MTDLTSAQILDLEIGENESGETTIRGYLLKLLEVLWDEEEGFSGKRPFGNSGWQYDIYPALIKAGVIKGTLDEDGYVETCAGSEVVDPIIVAAIRSMGAVTA